MRPSLNSDARDCNFASLEILSCNEAEPQLRACLRRLRQNHGSTLKNEVDLLVSWLGLASTHAKQEEPVQTAPAISICSIAARPCQSIEIGAARAGLARNGVRTALCHFGATSLDIALHRFSSIRSSLGPPSPGVS